VSRNGLPPRGFPRGRSYWCPARGFPKGCPPICVSRRGPTSVVPEGGSPSFSEGESHKGVPRRGQRRKFQRGWYPRVSPKVTLGLSVEEVPHAEVPQCGFPKCGSPKGCTQSGFQRGSLNSGQLRGPPNCYPPRGFLLRTSTKGVPTTCPTRGVPRG
jgi:hypothetical protein